MENVGECPDLVCAILRRLDRRRDLARCSRVSRLWRRCCADARGSVALAATHLVGTDRDFDLWTLDTATGELCFSSFGTYSGRILDSGMDGSRILCACEGLVVVLFDVWLLAIGEPILGKWRRLWNAEFPRGVVAGALFPDPDRTGGEIALAILQYNGRVDRYKFEEGRWEQQNAPFWGWYADSSTCSQLFYHQGGLFCVFQKCRGPFRRWPPRRLPLQNGIFRYNLGERKWSQLRFGSDQEEGDLRWPDELRFFHWNGRLMLCLSHSQQARVKFCECVTDGSTDGDGGGIHGRLVEVPSFLGAGVDEFYREFVGNENELFVFRGDHAVRLSGKDMSKTSFKVPRAIMSSVSCYTPDEGEAIGRVATREKSSDTAGTSATSHAKPKVVPARPWIVVAPEKK